MTRVFWHAVAEQVFEQLPKDIVILSVLDTTTGEVAAYTFTMGTRQVEINHQLFDDFIEVHEGNAADQITQTILQLLTQVY